MRLMFVQRQKGVKVTDKRVRLITETLQGIRLIKLYAWEDFYVRQIGNLRKEEIKFVRKFTYVLRKPINAVLTEYVRNSIARAFLVAMVSLVPILAAVLSFVRIHRHIPPFINLLCAILFRSLML